MNHTGIKFRLMLISIGPLVIFASLLTGLFIANRIDELNHALIVKGKIYADQLASSSVYGVFSANPSVLYEPIKNIFQQEDVVELEIKDKQGKSLIHLFRKDMQADETDKIFIQPILLLGIKSDEMSLFDIKGDPADQEKIGSVYVRLSLARTRSSSNKIIRDSLLIALVNLILVSLLAHKLGNAISSPIIKLTDAVKKISKGELSTRANVKAKGELEELRDGFNTMAAGLQQHYDHLDKKINEATTKQAKLLASLEKNNRDLDKAREFAEAQNQLKTEFIAHISHEIRTPMYAFIGFSEILLDSSLTTKQRNYIKLINKSAHSLMHIVNDILNLSSLETGHFSLNPKPFILRSVIEETVVFLYRPDRKVPIIIDIDSELPDWVNHDRTRFQQLITNLISNSIKFTQSGLIMIRVRLIQNLSTPFLLLSVSDTGPGIANELRRDMFSPFLKTSHYAINGEVGAGLGLTICKNIIERMEGKLGFISQQSVGSTFWFSIPLNVSKQTQSEYQLQPAILIGSGGLVKTYFAKQLTAIGFDLTVYESMDVVLENNEITDPIIFLYVENMDRATCLSLLWQVKAKNKSTLCLVCSEVEEIRLIDYEPLISLPCQSKLLLKMLPVNITELPYSITDEKISNKLTELKVSILLADDDETNRWLIKEQITTLHSEIYEAVNGQEALEMIQKQRFDLILLDFKMPILSGPEVIEQAKKLSTPNNDTPFVAITAHAQPEQKKEILNAGFVECLIKPIDPSDLVSVISKNILHPKSTFINGSNDPGNPRSQDLFDQLINNPNVDSKKIASLLEKLFMDLPKHFKQINKAVNEGNYRTAENIAHAMGSYTSTFGITNVRSAAEDLESHLLDPNMLDLDRLLTVLNQSITEVLAEKNQLMAKLKSDRQYTPPNSDQNIDG